jgi:hypothetical protein
VTYARMVEYVASIDRKTRSQLDLDFLKVFIERYVGYAGAITVSEGKDSKEVDFLNLGCER